MAEKMQPPTGFTRADLGAAYKADCEKAGRTLPYPVSCRVEKTTDKTNPEKPVTVAVVRLVYPDGTFTPAQSKKVPTGTVTGSYNPPPAGAYPDAGMNASRFGLHTAAPAAVPGLPNSLAEHAQKREAAEYAEWCRKQAKKKPKPKK